MNMRALLFPPGASKHDWVLDAALAVALGLFVVPVYLFSYRTSSPPSLIVTSAFMLVPLVWRRHSPILSLAGVCMAALAQLVVVDVPTASLVALPVIAYTMARWIPGHAARTVVVVGGVGSLLGPWRWLLPDPSAVSAQQAISFMLAVMVCLGLVVTPYAVGRRVRESSQAHDQAVASAEERYRALMIERDQQARLAESRVRTQIARELHDIVAHSLSVMIVQAEGGRAAAAKRPEAATDALVTIADTGREALGEMRRIVGVLRSEPHATAPDFAPAPRLLDIPDLVSRTSDRARLTVAGTPPKVTQAMELTVYRVVQEALTNFLKHAGPQAQATVTLTYNPRDITVDVLDDGLGDHGPDHEPGHGLRGMNERVTAMGGRLIARPRPAGGFQVTAVLPLGRRATTDYGASAEPDAPAGLGAPTDDDTADDGAHVSPDIPTDLGAPAQPDTPTQSGTTDYATPTDVEGERHD